MIQLTTKTTIQATPSISRFSGSFSKPIVFFLQSGSLDKRGILPTCAIFDCAKGEITYIHTLLPENLVHLDQIDPDATRFSLLKAGNDPHGALRVSEDRFLVSFQYAKLFLDFDTKNATVTIVEDTDLFSDRLSGVQFGATFFKTQWKKRNGKEYFYLTRGGKKSEPPDTFVLETYAASTDLGEFWKIQEKSFSYFPYLPHVSREFDNTLFQSHFLHIGFYIASTGETFPMRVKFLEKAYTDLEKLYRSTELGANEPLGKLYEMEAGNPKMWIDPKFDRFIQLLMKKLGVTDFYELTDKLFGYNVALLPGSFSTINLSTNEEQSYFTSTARSAHLEFDTERKRIYVSSHNFDPTPFGSSIAYFGPAKIDRFDIQEDGRIQLAGTFSNQSGFRFTSHRAFSYQGKPYVCTIGHPSRFFLINAETMELEYFFDILPTKLRELSWDAVLQYVKRFGFTKEETFLRPIEVSKDGRYVFLPGRDESWIFDIFERRIVDRISKPNIRISEMVNLSDFDQVGAHCQYLE